ncbi:hypothetical protein FGO68_gene7874 [Halteria grandinella]|uniref:Uncharacterized protein n=1 Tax=Halteria grandinella TaxID=5974 RepID=A0A8J8SYE1_HALGN|nr:hypothetical protein FGO68_gene7874 [Halteria grandinella]
MLFGFFWFRNRLKYYSSLLDYFSNFFMIICRYLILDRVFEHFILYFQWQFRLIHQSLSLVTFPDCILQTLTIY